MNWLSKTRRLGGVWWRLFRKVRALRRYDLQSGDANKPASLVDTVIGLARHL
tara:strand:- start:569 stop:724 length:156 start_codon:yes stop_codon:yes gene_type:complete